MRPNLRICLPRRESLRGAGLGNELFGWGKAFLASEALGAKLRHPSWGLNPRGYRHYFGTGRMDWANEAALRAILPEIRFDKPDYEATGLLDFHAAVSKFAHETDLLQKHAWALVTGGMWGGLVAIRRAFPFIRMQLLRATGTSANLVDLERRIPSGTMRIAVHIRLGDFLPSTNVANNTDGQIWNRALDIEWYINVCRSLQQQLSTPSQFMLFTDGTPEQVDSFVRTIQPITLFHQRMSVCSDLLAMSQADLLVCSRSSFSIWAAGLSGKPYIWHAGSLVWRGNSWSLWDHGRPGPEPGNTSTDLWPRGIPVGDSGRVPNQAVEAIQRGDKVGPLSSDLVFYGRVSPKYVTETDAATEHRDTDQ